MVLLPRRRLVLQLAIFATVLASCARAQPAASDPQPSAAAEEASTRAELGVEGQLTLLVDTPAGLVALGGGPSGPWVMRSLDGQSWQPAVAPPELRGKTVVASTMFKGASYVLLSGGESAASSLELLATTDGLSWQRIAPDLMAKAGIWGVGIVSLADQLVVVGATGGNGVGHAEVFTSPDGKTWKSVKNPGLTRKDGAPLSVASADGMVALLFSGQAGGGRPHVVTSDAALTSWSAVDLAEDSPAPIVIAPFLDGLAVAGCTRVPPTVGVAWLSSSPSGQFKALDPAPQQCVNAGASSGSELALATKTGAWFLDDNLKSSELPFLTRTTGALPVVQSVIHKGDAWVFGGQEHADGNALGASDIVVWSIRH